jgi:hypothetical protein
MHYVCSRELFVTGSPVGKICLEAFSSVAGGCSLKTRWRAGCKLTIPRVRLVQPGISGGRASPSRAADRAVVRMLQSG